MATTKEVLLCPRCKSELSSADAETCNVCGIFLKEPDNPDFEVPDYTYYQLVDHLERISNERNLSKKADREYELRGNQRVFWQKCKDSTRLACIEDAFDMIKDLIHSNATDVTARDIGVRAKQIGDMAAGITLFLKAGGYLNGTPVFKAPKDRSGDEDSLQAAGVGD